MCVCILGIVRYVGICDPAKAFLNIFIRLLKYFYSYWHTSSNTLPLNIVYEHGRPFFIHSILLDFILHQKIAYFGLWSTHCAVMDFGLTLHAHCRTSCIGYMRTICMAAVPIRHLDILSFSFYFSSNIHVVVISKSPYVRWTHIFPLLLYVLYLYNIVLYTSYDDGECLSSHNWSMPSFSFRYCVLNHSWEKIMSNILIILVHFTIESGWLSLVIR